MTVIREFTGKYRFLSNFYPCTVRFSDGRVAKSSEHAYMACKTTDAGQRDRILACETPAQAKRLGRSIPLRDGWNDMRVEVMEACLRSKFSNPELRSKLLATGEAELVEGNKWGDKFWGVCNGVGENQLGKLLMKLRAEYRG